VASNPTNLRTLLGLNFSISAGRQEHEILHRHHGDGAHADEVSHDADSSWADTIEDGPEEGLAYEVGNPLGEGDHSDLHRASGGREHELR
jgi:hypothetical protein